MPYQIIKPILLNQKVSELCKKPYYNHPYGCPNFNTRLTYPTLALPLYDIISNSKPIYVIWNIFPFKQHIERMKKMHPDWSNRQLECCLYWQRTARKQLKLEVSKFLEDRTWFLKDIKIIWIPEACSVNITKTMEQIDLILEWPPKIVTYQVALAGISINAI